MATPGRTATSAQPGTLVLRVEGPAAIEIQHLADVICERVNRFLGWRAVARHRAAPGAAAPRRAQARTRPPIRRATRQIAATLSDVGDENLERRWRGSARRSIKRP